MKTIFCILAMIGYIGIINAQLPYSNLLDLSVEELKSKGFKYDEDKNQYVLKKTNILNATGNILNILADKPADVQPDKNDYVIVIQDGKEGVSSLTATFYNDDTYLNIENWIAENGIQPIRTNTGEISMERFTFDNYLVTLTTEQVLISTTTDKTKYLSKTLDTSYNVYIYEISTGIPPFSKWHEKEEQKRIKKQHKNKKGDMEDLMQ